MARYFYPLLLSLMMIPVLVSCSSDSDDSPSQSEQTAAKNKAAIIGTWVAKYSAFVYKEFTEVSSHDTLTFKTDGTYRKAYEKVNTPLNGTYTVDDRYLTLGGLFLYDISFNKDTMMLRDYGYGSDTQRTKYLKIKAD